MDLQFYHQELMQNQLHHRILIDFSRAQTAPLKYSAPSEAACKVMVDADPGLTSSSPQKAVYRQESKAKLAQVPNIQAQDVAESGQGRCTLWVCISTLCTWPW